MHLSFKLSSHNPVKLPPKVKEDWVAALRSGKYKQAPNYLHRGDSYCCLGVIYEVCGGKWDPCDSSAIKVYQTSDFAFGLPTSKDLPHDVNMALMQYVDGADFSDEANVMGALANANDKGATFAEIADWIEANL